MAGEVCSQGDGRAAIASVNGAPLCVECFTKLQAGHAEQQNLTLQFMRHQMAMANQALDDMEDVTGIYGLTRRFQIPPMPATGPVTLNHFKLDNSTVASINTGTISTIDFTVTQLQGMGNKDAAKALHDVTKAVLNEGALTPAEKNELLEQIAFLSEQATNVKDRKPGMIRATLDGITRTAGAVAGVAGAWQAAAPILKAIFELH